MAPGHGDGGGNTAGGGDVVVLDEYPVEEGVAMVGPAPYPDRVLVQDP